jgi:hypothetical protein
MLAPKREAINAPFRVNARTKPPPTTPHPINPTETFSTIHSVKTLSAPAHSGWLSRISFQDFHWNKGTVNVFSHERAAKSSKDCLQTLKLSIFFKEKMGRK